MKRNNGRLHNATGTATGATRILELLVKEFILSSYSEQQVLVGENSKIEYTYGWYSANAVNK
jgi:hypothetical protein